MTRHQIPPNFRLQGTDGIRGRVQRQEFCSEQDPIAAFINLGILTDLFFELYTYSFCQYLIQMGFAQSNDCVVIGWDPRDREGVFNQAAIRGIQKSGLTVYQVGVLPTPAVALYLLQCQASCAFVLTASHNPSDQNGIKIFLGHLGLKLFPSDDYQFTQQILQIDLQLLSQLPLKGPLQDHSEKAKESFVRFSLDPFNSWHASISLKNWILLIDGANGAYSHIIQNIFETIPTKEIIYTNVDLNQEINFRSGVADLEGLARISAEMVDPPSGQFSAYPTIQLLFDYGRKHRQALTQGMVFCCALVFDGDGDRFFRLDYDPFEDDVIVLSGDKLAYFQGSYLTHTHDQSTSPIFVNTVESDMEVNRALQTQGFETLQTAVGDKWILWQAILEGWKLRKSLFHQTLPSIAFQKRLDDCETLLNDMRRHSTFNALEVTQAFIDVEHQFLELGGTPKQLSEINWHWKRSDSSRFCIGSEDSGHIISAGSLTSIGIDRVIYIGNGLKSALNTFRAVEFLRPDTIQTYYQWLDAPFPHGFQKSSPVYYVNPSLLNPTSDFRKVLAKFILDTLQKKWPDKTTKEIFRPEEPSMLFLLIQENNHLVASIFIRNSGTEDKMTLYIRGQQSDQHLLSDLHTTIFLFLLPRVKITTNPFAQAEFSILKQLKNSPLEQELIQISPELINSAERLFEEMSTKQGLIIFESGKWQLTSRAHTLLDFSERSEIL